MVGVQLLAVLAVYTHINSRFVIFCTVIQIITTTVNDTRYEVLMSCGACIDRGTLSSAVSTTTGLG